MKQSKTWLKFAWLESVSGTCYVELDKLPKLNNTKSNTPRKRLIVESAFFRFIRIKSQNACLMIYFSTNQMQIESNENVLAEYHKNKNSLTL